MKFKNNNESEVDSFPHRFVSKLLSTMLPEANPDFDSKMDFVKVWLLEFPNENSLPEMGIGVDDNNFVIVKMPDSRNCGY